MQAKARATDAELQAEENAVQLSPFTTQMNNDSINKVSAFVDKVKCNRSDDHNIILVHRKQRFAYINLDAKEELFASDNRLEKYLNGTTLERGVAPLDNVIRGHARLERKRLKTEGLEPMVFMNLNTSLEKAEPVIVQDLLVNG